MTFPILGGNGAVAGYSIDNSLRFNDDDSPQLSRSTGTTNKRTFTVSVWVKRTTNGARQVIWSSDKQTNDTGDGSKGGSGIGLQFWNDDKFYLGGFGGNFQIRSNGLQRDNSSWYHIVAGIDTTQSDQNNRAKLYINGENVSSLTAMVGQNTDVKFATNRIGVKSETANYSDADSLGSYLDGYVTELHVIDGQQLSPTDFGEFSEEGIWKPIEYSGSYGSDGYYLDFENSGSLGADQSGNSNNFTPTNLASTDQMLDTPTNNFATLNSLTPVVTHTLSEVNLKSTNSSGTHGGATATINYPTSGKWYHEVRINAEDSSKGQGVAIGNQIYRDVTEWGNYRNLIGYFSDGSKQTDGGYSSYGVVHNAGDIIGVAYNADDQELTFYHDNSSQGTITTSEMDGTIDFNNLCPIVFGRNMGQTFNFGQDSSFAGAETRQNNSDGNGFGDFYYAPPSGYLALCTQNLATALSPTIDDGSQYFNTVLYTGNGGTNNITGVGFQPDWVWIKERGQTADHFLGDSSRGATKYLLSNANIPEGTNANTLQSFDSDGFTLGSDGFTNNNTDTFVAWNWKANAGTTSSNTDGSITSTVQANTTAGFSIVTYTGTGSASTVGHGLGVAPKMLIVKERDNANDWKVYHHSIGNDKTVRLDATDAQTSDPTTFNSTTPTSSVFSVNSNATNRNGGGIIAYCFAEIEGYSKFGSYVGNNSSTDGTFVYLGFRPSFVLAKNISRLETWWIRDSARDTYNPTTKTLKPQNTVSEQTAGGIDLLSNGFKLRNNDWSYNYTDTYIYMAFAENPFVTSSGVPVTAR